MKVRKIDYPGWRDVFRLEDMSCGLVAFLAIHTEFFGRSFGGIRIRRYDDEDGALADAAALARAMSYKLAFTGIEGGGAKTVILDSPTLDRRNAVRILGEHVESLGGRYRCGGDLGFTAEDEEVLRKATSYSACGDLGDATGEGVVAAIEGTMDTVDRTIDTIHVTVQGAGSVGGAVVRRLRRAGARITVADVDPARTEIEPEKVFDLEADVFSPCAIGGVLDEKTIPRLRVRAVIGGANNPLSAPGDAKRLHERGIIYVPDYVSNSGATIRGALAMLDRDEDADAGMAALRGRVGELIRRARASGRTPLETANEIAEERIREWSGG